MIVGLVAFVFMLGVIVLIHEFGHYIAARHFGVYVREFSLGMGPVLWQKPGKETLFSIRAIPFGGYCMMAGEADNRRMTRMKRTGSMMCRKTGVSTTKKPGSRSW